MSVEQQWTERDKGKTEKLYRKHPDLVPLYSTVLKCYFYCYTYCYFASYGSSDRDARQFYFYFEIIITYHRIITSVTL